MLKSARCIDYIDFLYSHLFSRVPQDLWCKYLCEYGLFGDVQPCSGLGRNLDYTTSLLGTMATNSSENFTISSILK